MTIGISLYRARVGGFHDRAAQLSVFKLAFILPQKYGRFWHYI